jgi:hypothetical protein
MGQTRPLQANSPKLPYLPLKTISLNTDCRTFPSSFQSATPTCGMRAGVAPGSPVSPVLFSLYMNTYTIPPRRSYAVRGQHILKSTAVSFVKTAGRVQKHRSMQYLRETIQSVETQKIEWHLCRPRADWSHPRATDVDWLSVGRRRLSLKTANSATRFSF